MCVCVCVCVFLIFRVANTCSILYSWHGIFLIDSHFCASQKTCEILGTIVPLHRWKIWRLKITWLCGKSLVAQMVKNLPAIQETQVWSLGWEDPWRREWHSLQYSCLENSMDRGAWWATVHGVAKSPVGLRDKHFHFPWPVGVMQASPTNFSRLDLLLSPFYWQRERS